jgi:hypothetical protein
MRDIVVAMLDASTASMESLRARISCVKWGPIEGNYETITFSVDGATYSGICTGRNRDWVVYGDDRESDRALALRVLLDGFVHKVSEEAS